MKKITVTGTKGKTTVSNILAGVLRQFEPKVLHVDTNGAYVNGELKISKKASQTIWDIVPTVSPGRFLFLVSEEVDKQDPNMLHPDVSGAAVLEASLGCGTVSGLGYYGHDVGVFTNVFEDHLGSRPDLNVREDIARSKNFIFSRINRDGTAVFNADDDAVCGQLNSCKEGVNLLPFGRDFKFFDLKGHLKSGGYAMTVKDGDVVLLHGDSAEKLLDVDSVGWTFDGRYEPSVMNLLAITAALFAYFGFTFPVEVKNALIDSKLDPYSGRLVMLRNEAGVTILADYAHEKQSLTSIAELARKLTKDSDNKVIGVLRLAWDRTEELIEETAGHIADSYDYFIIYDKIDGHFRQPSERFRTYQRQFKQEVGKISKCLAGALKKKRGEEAVERIIREDEAITAAAKRARPGDVVVVIVNDDIVRSIDWIRESFKADFV